MTDLEKALAEGNTPCRRADLRDLLVGNTLYLDEDAVSFYASPSIRLTMFQGSKYCTEWALASSGDIVVQSLRTYRREVYRVLRCLGPDNDFAADDATVSLFRDDDSWFGALNHAPGNRFDMVVDGATFVTI
ncbi:MAG: hypothetical protein ABS81_06485 [Pseudonocardia sp. SCN 72-86]|nr:MAG: hypothetical protein ABS81_06485 [Pseudonocardia sp. SCN 72-86]